MKQGGAFIESPQNLRADNLPHLVQKGEVPRSRSSNTSDKPGAPDANPYPAMPWGLSPGVECAECAELYGTIFLQASGAGTLWRAHTVVRHPGRSFKRKEDSQGYWQLNSPILL